MRSSTRIALLGLLTLAVLSASAPGAQAAFGVQEKSFEAGTCLTSSCTYASVEKNRAEAYTQAAGHPPVGLTTFELNHVKGLLGEEPEGALRRVRVDVPVGLAADPQALEQCSKADFEAEKCPAGSRVGTNELTVLVKSLGINLTVEAPVYDLIQPPGLPLEFGIHVEALGGAVNEHVFLEGHLSWSSDYHEYFEIRDIEQENPVLKSKLIFDGTAGGDFLTLPSECSATTTSELEVESGSGEISRTQTHTPVGVEGCGQVPFNPTAEIVGETGQSDSPDGARIEVNVPQHAGAGEVNTADVKDVHLTLPEGLTINPSAAHGLEACTAAEIAIGTSAPVSCPAASELGAVTIESPDQPPASLAGELYLGDPSGGPIEGPPYTVYLDAESVYGVSVRLGGSVNPNPATGRLEASFDEDPELPLTDLVVKLNGGPRAPLANPLACGAEPLEAVFSPYGGSSAALSSTPFTTGGCPSPLAFSLAQSTGDASLQAGAHTSYTLNLTRPDGQQYLSQVQSVLPAGLLGVIPSVALCAEAQAVQGTCSAASQIGTATVAAGAGAEPYTFEGPVFLTGPYGGAPYGLSIPIAAVAGPFDLGTIVTRASINVDPASARVIVTSTLPRIVAGVPIRLRAISVTIDRPNFLLNPTSCGPLFTETTLTSTFAATQSLPTPFAVSNCGALGFDPLLTASTSAHASKADGATLATTISQPPGEANIHSVAVELPSQLVTRLTTLQQACPEATYAANPASCPASSEVGSASATTPVLAGTLTGPAYLVSHGGEAFPDLDLQLEGGGVRVVLVGNTNIKAGRTRTTFASLPDVPISSFALTLPMGPHSVLGANGSLCPGPLAMPTTIVAQNGAQVQQSTRVSVAGCARGQPPRSANPRPPRRPSHPAAHARGLRRRPRQGHRQEPEGRLAAPGQGVEDDAQDPALARRDEGARLRAPAEGARARRIPARQERHIGLLRLCHSDVPLAEVDRFAVCLPAGYTLD